MPALQIYQPLEVRIVSVDHPTDVFFDKNIFGGAQNYFTRVKRKKNTTPKNEAAKKTRTAKRKCVRGKKIFQKKNPYST